MHEPQPEIVYMTILVRLYLKFIIHPYTVKGKKKNCKIFLSSIMNRFLTTHTKGASISISHHKELFQELLSTILCLPPYVANVWKWIQSSLRVYLDCSSFPCPSDCLTDCLLLAPLRFLIWPFFFPPLLYLFPTLFCLLISRKHTIPIPTLNQNFCCVPHSSRYSVLSPQLTVGGGGDRV